MDGDTESVGKLKSCHFNEDEEFFCPRDAFYVEHAEMGGAVDGGGAYFSNGD